MGNFMNIRQNILNILNVVKEILCQLSVHQVAGRVCWKYKD